MSSIRRLKLFYKAFPLGYVEEEYTTGAIDQVWNISKSVKLSGINIECSTVPSSEKMIITLKNVSGKTIRIGSFDPSEDDVVGISRTFNDWYLPSYGGTIRVEYPNTGNVVSSILIDFLYSE